MSKYRRWTLDQLLRSGNRSDVLLAKVESADGPAWFFNGIGILDYDGAEWLGLGRMASVSFAPATTEVQVQDVTITLAGVDDEHLAYLDQSVKGRSAWFWKAFLDEEYRVRFTVLLSDCRLDQASLQVQPNGQSVIQITGVGGFYFFERQEQAFWDTEHQRDMLSARGLDPDSDTGFDMMMLMKNRQLAWERPG